MKKTNKKPCKFCKTQFIPKNRKNIFCSTECRKHYYADTVKRGKKIEKNLKSLENNPFSSLSTVKKLKALFFSGRVTTMHLILWPVLKQLIVCISLYPGIKIYSDKIETNTCHGEVTIFVNFQEKLYKFKLCIASYKNYSYEVSHIIYLKQGNYSSYNGSCPKDLKNLKDLHVVWYDITFAKINITDTPESLSHLFALLFSRRKG